MKSKRPENRQVQVSPSQGVTDDEKNVGQHSQPIREVNRRQQEDGSFAPRDFPCPLWGAGVRPSMAGGLLWAPPWHF